MEKQKAMKPSTFKIVFMGTPEFAVTILEGLLEKQFDIVGVVTAPDKPSGRGQKVQESAVKIFASKQELNILQPTNLKDETFVQQLTDLNADLFVVVAFRMLPEIVWSMPPKGTINLHASLLPNYRGAAPINWAVINGEEKTGVTTFFIEKEIDTGLIIEREEIQISENETAGSLHDRLMMLGKRLIQKSVMEIHEGNVVKTPQSQLIDSDIPLKSAPKIFKPMCEIDWSKTVKEVHDHVRGLSPYPTAWVSLINSDKNEVKIYKLFQSEKTTLKINDSTKIIFTKEGILFPCMDYYLLVLEIQPEGKKRMLHNEFSAGYSLQNLNLHNSE
jgi:methionyl-tRNA formyltransferase